MAVHRAAVAAPRAQGTGVLKIALPRSHRAEDAAERARQRRQKGRERERESRRPTADRESPRCRRTSLTGRLGIRAWCARRDYLRAWQFLEIGGISRLAEGKRHSLSAVQLIGMSKVVV